MSIALASLFYTRTGLCAIAMEECLGDAEGALHLPRDISHFGGPGAALECWEGPLRASDGC